MRIWWALSAAVALSGCAPTLSSLTPAHVAKPKHVQMELGMGLAMTGGGLPHALNVGENLDQQSALSVRQQRQLINSEWANNATPSGVEMDLGVAVGVAENWEVSGRATTAGLRLGGRHQFLKQRVDGLDLSVGLGLRSDAYRAAGTTAYDSVETNKLSNWGFDIPVLLGGSGDWFRWWTGTRILAWHYATRFDMQTTNASGQMLAYSIDGTGGSVCAAGVLGGALGYEHVFLAFELTAGYLGTAARLQASRDDVGSFSFRSSSLVVFPAIGLLSEY